MSENSDNTPDLKPDMALQPEQKPLTPDQALDEIFGAAEGSESAPKTTAATDTEPGGTDGEPAGDRSVPDDLIQALRRDGVPQKVIDHFVKTDPDHVREWAAKAKQRQADVDSLGNRLRDAVKESPSQTEPSDGGEAEAPKDRNLDILKDLFGEEAARAIVAGMRSGSSDAQKQAGKALEMARLSRLEHLGTTAALKVAAERGLGLSEIPRIQEMMSDIGKANPGRFNTVDEIAAAAAERLYGRPSANGTPSLMRGDQPRRPMSRDEQIELIAELCLQGVEPNEARRRAGLEPLDY